MRFKNLTSKLFTLRCDNQKVLLSKITGLFERQGFPVLSMSQSATDISSISLVMVEAVLPAANADEMITLLNQITGVTDAVISFGDVQRVGYFRLCSSVLSKGLLLQFQQQGAQPVNWSAGSILLQKHGRLDELRSFYNLIDGPELIGSCYHPLPINENGLIGMDSFSAGITKLQAEQLKSS